MKLWTKIGIGVAAILIAVAAGTTIYAMSGGDDGDGDNTEQAARDDAEGGDDKRSPNDVASICIEGTTDCNDTPTDGGFAQCASEGVECGDFDCDTPDCGGTRLADCPPDHACIEPWLMDPPTCPDGVEIDECFPDGVPAGYECVTLESFPVQVKCSAIYCEFTTLPAPAEDPGIAPGEPAPSPVEDEELERLREETPCVLPPDECDDASGRCLPPDCSISSDGTIACPGGPPIEECIGGPAVDCIAPDLPVECVPGPAVDCYEPNAPQTEPGSGSGSVPEPRDQ